MSTTDKTLRTTKIPIEELKPCFFCKGAIAPIFFSIEIKHGCIGQGAREFAGFQLMGFPAELARVFTSQAGAEVLENNVRRLFCCNTCFLRLPTELLAAWEGE